MKVANGKCIRRLSIQSMRAARVRNRVAVAAIALTTLLFTALFTIAMSMVSSFEESNFRMVGGYAHGGFKYLTQEQFEALKDDPLIREYGMRRILGMAEEEPFQKSHVEISYSDPNTAKWMFLEPTQGRLPQENTNEAATDTRILSLLGITPELGTEFTLTFTVDGVETTQRFTLCGWWEYDEAIVANHVLIPESRVNAVFAELGLELQDGGLWGSWNMDVMLRSPAHIETDLLTILGNHGYQAQEEGDNYIGIGVNWGYVSAQLSDSMDFGTILSLAAMLLLIVFTGYLVIYNVFRISVSNDIRAYGLLKTIGTTGRQLRRIVRIQAFLLSAVGIPIGLLAGYGVGALLTPVILDTFEGITTDSLSQSPWIFVGSTLFSLVTVALSCRKPSKLAARVSPIEALRYTESGGGKRKRRAGRGASVYKMAFANLGRSKGKTAVTVLSLSLAVVLLEITFTFTNGFDMDKYLRDMTVDFIVADARYFQTRALFHAALALPEEVIDAVSAQGGIARGGRTYGDCGSVGELLTEERFRKAYGYWGAQMQEGRLAWAERTEDGRLNTDVALYGMEDFCLEQLTVLEGDTAKLSGEGNYIAAVYLADDYDNPIAETHWAQVGDKVTLRYTEEYEYYNPDTGAVYAEDEDLSMKPYRMRSVRYRDVEYEVAALVMISGKLNYRYYGDEQYVLGAQAFIRDTGTDAVLHYSFDMQEGGEDAMEEYLADFTGGVSSRYDYESKKFYEGEFEGLRSMFVILGGTLSFIVGLVGVLNFLNAVLTGITTRHREFAVLQAVGMTGRQLKTMLAVEGLFYALGSVALSLILCMAVQPLISNVLGEMFWFFTYRFTITPIIAVTPFFIVLGVALPLALYRFAARRSIVERIREAE
ncbi:MAG: ABC transporter permease [Roseburia sp.]|nr:ABC transporter permease [Roseburia sp.]